MIFFKDKALQIPKKNVSLQSFSPYIGEDSNIVVTKIEKYDVKFNWI